MSSHKGLRLGPKVSWLQMELLVSFLEQHDCLVENSNPSTRRSRLAPVQKRRQLWRQLAGQLNDQGPSTKSPALWRVVWRRIQRKARDATEGESAANQKLISGKVRGLLERVAALVGPTGEGRSEDNTQGMAGGSGSGRHLPISKRDTQDIGDGQGAPFRAFRRIAPAPSRPPAVAAAPFGGLLPSSSHFVAEDRNTAGYSVLDLKKQSGTLKAVAGTGAESAASGSSPILGLISACGGPFFVSNNAEASAENADYKPPLATQAVWLSADDHWQTSSDQSGLSPSDSGSSPGVRNDCDHNYGCRMMGAGTSAGACQQAERSKMEGLLTRVAADYAQSMALAQESKMTLERLSGHIAELASAAGRQADAQQRVAAAVERQAQAVAEQAEAIRRVAAACDRLATRHSQMTVEDDMLAATATGLLTVLQQLASRNNE
ncbi:uncharacterized protein LOC144179418 isoform X1 [Haemaphysalis longicornis]